MITAAAEKGVVVTDGWVYLLPRILGITATLKQAWPEAQRHFETAIDIAIQLDMRPELGRTYLDYARMLSHRQEPASLSHAVALLDKAQAIFEPLAMQPFAAQATQLAVRLQAQLEASQPVQTPSPITIGKREAALLEQLTLQRISFLG